MKVGGHQLVGIAVIVFPVPADFEGGLDAMIQPVVEVLYVNQAMGEPLYRGAMLSVKENRTRVHRLPAA
jgi:hypothetical protein